MLGESHPNTLSSADSLADLYERQGRYEEALPLYQECLEKRKVILGESHPDTLYIVSHQQSRYAVHYARQVRLCMIAMVPPVC